MRFVERRNFVSRRRRRRRVISFVFIVLKLTVGLLLRIQDLRGVAGFFLAVCGNFGKTVSIRVANLGWMGSVGGKGGGETP